MNPLYQLADSKFSVRANKLGEQCELTIDGNPIQLEINPTSDNQLEIRYGDQRVVAKTVHDGDYVYLHMFGRHWCLEKCHSRLSLGGAAAGDGVVSSTMPGTVIEVNTADGQQVAEGDRLAIMESMKMQVEIFSPVNGRVRAVSISAGDEIEKHTVLFEIEKEPGEDA